MEIVKGVIYDNQYVTLNKKQILELEKLGKETYFSNMGEDGENEELQFEDCSLNVEEMYFSDGEIILNCIVNTNGKEIAYLCLSIPIDRKIALNIIEEYMKKMGRVKTVLEATKDF